MARPGPRQSSHRNRWHDNGPVELIERLVEKAGEAGREAILEIAAAFSVESLTSETAGVERIFSLNGNGLSATYTVPGFRPGVINSLDEKPWDVGHRLAQQLRLFLDFGNRAVSTDALAGLFDLNRDALISMREESKLPLRRCP